MTVSPAELYRSSHCINKPLRPATCDGVLDGAEYARAADTCAQFANRDLNPADDTVARNSNDNCRHRGSSGVIPRSHGGRRHDCDDVMTMKMIQQHQHHVHHQRPVAIDLAAFVTNCYSIVELHALGHSAGDGRTLTSLTESESRWAGSPRSSCSLKSAELRCPLIFTRSPLLLTYETGTQAMQLDIRDGLSISTSSASATMD